MNTLNGFLFVLLHISTVLALWLLLVMFKMPNKTKLHRIFQVNMGLVFVWSLGQLLEVYTSNAFGHVVMPFVYFYYIGVCFLPVSLLFTGLIYAKTDIDFSPKHLWLLTPPSLAYLLLVTNDLHRLFFVKFSPLNSEVIYGPAFFVHNIPSYIYIIIGIGFLLVFTKRNAGFFSKQSMLVLVGIAVPFAVNIVITYKILTLPTFITPIAFTFAVLCFFRAILKYKFLNILPIALQYVVDRISDGFLVVNERLDIIDFNLTFVNTFKPIVRLARNDNLLLLQSSNQPFSAYLPEIIGLIDRLKLSKEPVSLEKHILQDKFDKYFLIEVTPIASNVRNIEKIIGTLIMFKDITQHKKYLHELQEHQQTLAERSKLRTLVQIAGDVAHEINTPLATVEEISLGLQDLPLDPKTISQIGVIHRSTKRAIKAANRLREQTQHIFDESPKEFDIKRLIADCLDGKALLLKARETGSRVTISGEVQRPVTGYPNNLSKVLINLIMNSMESYDKMESREKIVEILLETSADTLTIEVKDYGAGISEKLKPDIFNKPLKTMCLKEDGGGFGLFISQIIVTGQLQGKIWFDSEAGQGSSFFVSIPFECSKRLTQGG